MNQEFVDASAIHEYEIAIASKEKIVKATAGRKEDIQAAIDRMVLDFFQSQPQDIPYQSNSDNP